MQALILAAGLGTRLRPLTDVRAKPAMPVAGEPIIRRIIAWLVSHDITDIVVNLHHRPQTLASVLGDGSDLGAAVRYSWEQPVVLGSAGGPRKALSIVGADRFFVINGDTLTNVDLAALAAEHDARGAAVTLALVPNRAFLQYGGVVLDDEARVTGFVRRGPAAEGSWHYIGAQVVDAAVFRDRPIDVAENSIGGVYDRLLEKAPGSVRGFRCDAAFWDIGTATDYWRTSLQFMSAAQRDRFTSGRGVRVADTARVTCSILWDDVEIGDGAEIAECIVTDGVRVPDRVVYRQSILMRSGERDVTVVPLTC